MNKRQAIMKMITDNPHLSVSELSKRTGLSRTVFYKWKSGDFDNIQIKSVQAVADATSTTITIDGDNIEIIDDINLKKESIMNVEASYIIDLQKENIEMIKIIQDLKNQLSQSSHLKVKPAYHFKLISTYKADTDEWLHTDIFGDFSMTGFTYEEIVPLMNEENDDDSWIDRYHPDSRKRLTTQTLKDIKTDYHYLKWEHMMWRAKDGQYKCYNIDLLYRRAEEKVTSMFYWVNGDGKG